MMVLLLNCMLYVNTNNNTFGQGEWLQSDSVLIGCGRFTTVLFSLQSVPDFVYGIRAVHRVILVTLFVILLIILLITQILCQGSINYLLQLNAKNLNNAVYSEVATLSRRGCVALGTTSAVHRVYCHAHFFNTHRPV